MGQEPVADHLELWRGIDDAIWREALRRTPAATILLPPPPADHRPTEPVPARQPVREPA